MLQLFGVYCKQYGFSVTAEPQNHAAPHPWKAKYPMFKASGSELHEQTSLILEASE